MRVIDPKYYGGESERDAVLRKLLDASCRFVIGGRIDANGRFREWDGGGLSNSFAPLFLPLTENDFRADVSSTQLRDAR